MMGTVYLYLPAQPEPFASVYDFLPFPGLRIRQGGQVWLVRNVEVSPYSGISMTPGTVYHAVVVAAKSVIPQKHSAQTAA